MELTCNIHVSMMGEGIPVYEDFARYDDRPFVGTGQCPIGELDDPAAPDFPVDDLVQTIEGTFDGTIDEYEPNDNGQLDGFAQATFELEFVAETTGQGVLSTGDVPPTLQCDEMDLSVRPATYDCFLLEAVELVGSDATVMLTALDLTFMEQTAPTNDTPTDGDVVTPVPPTEGPEAGFGPGDAGSDSINGFVIALAAVGGLLIAGAGALVLSRRE